MLSNRLNPTSLRIRDELAKNTLGKMLSIKAVLTWSRSKAYYSESPWRGRFVSEGGSLLINQAIHTLDLMQWFAGGVTRLKGVVDSGELADVTEAEDSAMATLHFANGARGLFYASNCNTLDSPLQLEIHCEHGMLQLTDNTLWRVTTDRRLKLDCDGSPDGHSKVTGAWATSRPFVSFIMLLLMEVKQNISILMMPANHWRWSMLFIIRLKPDNG